MIIVLIGVSGSGKTTIGELLSEELDIPFLDGDSFHPPANVEKMAKKIPLTDEDRVPWLQCLRDKITEHIAENKRAIFACSALKESYREILKGENGDVVFIHLHGTQDTISGRLETRSGHFMPPELLQSQFDTLEDPTDAVTIDISTPPDVVVENIRRKLEI